MVKRALLCSLGFLGFLIVALPTWAAADHGSRRRSALPDHHGQVQATEPAASAEPDGDADRRWWPATATVGPALVTLRGEATLDLPADFVYLGGEDSKKLMEDLGNKPSPSDVGTIMPKVLVKGHIFFVSVEWDAAGYIKDEEGDKLDPKAILESIREGNEAGNQYRKEHGFKPVEVVGWAEPPRYERSAHHIVWAIRGKSENGESVNFNTRILGREGYLSLNLICGPDQLGELKPVAQLLLEKTTFDGGKRYADFQPKKDKVAEFGLAALVVGGAAVVGKTALKVGLLAKFGKVILAFLFAMKKAVVLLFVGAWAGIKRFFGGKGATTATSDKGATAATSDTRDTGDTAAPLHAAGSTPPAAVPAASPDNGQGVSSAEGDAGPSDQGHQGHGPGSGPEAA